MEVSHSKEKGAKGIVTSPLLPTIGGGGGQEEGKPMRLTLA
jgi:hypothetical protein